jgi:voltage-gated potassium channel
MNNTAGTKLTRRRLLLTGLRMVAATILLLVIYSLVPVSDDLRGSVILNIVLAVLVFVAVIAWEIRGILKNDFPQLRALSALAVIIPLFIVSFAWSYLNYSIYDPTMFDISLNKTSAIYFTITVFSTVGFGDITPKSSLGQILVSVQMVADLALIAVGVNAILKIGSRMAATRNKS